MSVTSLLRKAVELESRGQIADAVSGYQRVLTSEPNNIEALIRLGHAQLQQGQLSASLTALRKAVTLDPGQATALTLLGAALARSGQTQDALACFDRAAAANPSSDSPLSAKADALAELGRPAEAVAEFDKAIARNARNFATWCNRGLALEALGRDADAATSFERALALQPNVPEIHFNLGNALSRLERHDEAVQHYRLAVAQLPQFARAHANLASSLFKLRRWEDALASLQHVVRLEPDNARGYEAIANAQQNLERDHESLASFDKALAIDPNETDFKFGKAKLLQVLGRIDEARALLQEIIALKPREVRFYAVLAPMKRFAVGDPLIAVMEAMLSDTGALPPDQQADLHFALARAYADIDDTQCSFRHLKQGNTLVRSQYDYNENDEFAMKEHIARVFTPELMRSKAGAGNLSDRPIFIVGMMRSGTTLIEQILASHPRVFGAGEQRHFVEATLAQSAHSHAPYPEFVETLTPEQLTELGTDYLARMKPVAGDRERFTDKLPGNHDYVGLIHLALPNARIIHAMRDPIDTCTSIFSISFAERINYASDLGELGRFYRAYERLMNHWRRVLPDGVMLGVQYEDVIDDIERQARRMIDFCGLDWDDACLAFHKTKRAVRTASVTQVRQPIYRNAIGRWRPYRDQLQPLFEALGVNPD